ncbi:MAG: 1-acylglycerol-3-phosphate O-acyltransferase [Rhodoferax sp.]|nr:1-acylglycerol-3-phosphate O-acyltransferase [Rhodoferax sp.]
MLHVFRLIFLGVHFLIACCINFVIVFLRPFNPDNTRLCARVYSLPAIPILGLQTEFKVQALKECTQPCVLVANHQSNFDLFIFGSVMPRRTVTIGKESLKWVPFFGQIYWLAGNVLIDRGNAEKAKLAMRKATSTLAHANTSIWVFVEGTRNLGKGLLPFKKGAFQMAITAGVPIVPVCISTYRRTMRLNRLHAGKVIIKDLPAIPTTGMTMEDVPALMAQCRNAMLACIATLDQDVALHLHIPDQ